MDTNLLLGHLEHLFIQVALNRVHLIVSFLLIYNHEYRMNGRNE